MAGRIKEFVGNWDAVWENIQLRADCKQAIVDKSIETEDASLLEAPFVIMANDQFHLISEKINAKKSHFDSTEILFQYKEWLRKEIKKRKVE